jgi:PAS domain S-box-containing protein
MIMTGSHDSVLVFLSIFIAVFASYTALSLASRARASGGRMRLAWLATASLAMGGGIWSMHFVAMLAFSMPDMAMAYDPGLTLLSLGLALSFTGAGFALMNWRGSSLGTVAGAGLLIGFGVVTMHYVGMAAMSMDATLSYEPVWLGISVFIAIGAATAAVWLAALDHRTSHRIAAAAVMGSAIAGMHYAGMRAAIFTRASSHHTADGLASLSQTYLAIAISGLTALILLLALGAARVERSFAAYAKREARIALRLDVADVLRQRETKEALNQIASLLGKHFAVSRVGYGQHCSAENSLDFEVCWTDGSVPPLLGRFPATVFGSVFAQALAGAGTIVAQEPAGMNLREAVPPLQKGGTTEIRSVVAVPFDRPDGSRTIIYLSDTAPRAWHQEEIRFLEEIAERIRLVIERALVEEQLRELNATLEARVEARTVALRQAEEARRAADALYRAYFESSPDPLFVIGVAPDGGFVVEEINPAHEQGVGFKLEEVRGKRIDSLLPAADAERILDTYRRAVQTREVYHFRDTFETSGEPQHWDTTLVPLCNDKGEVTRLFGSSRNVTRQVVAEEALRQSQKMEAIGQLTGGVAHDFNNLLTPIIGALDRLTRKGVGDERDQRLIKGAAQAAERSKILVQRLLSFARRQPLQPVPVNLGRLVTEMAGLISSTSGPQIRVLMDAPDDLPPAVADPNQLEMALLNLCVNARDAMPDGGTLRVSVSAQAVAFATADQLQPGSYLCVSVADSGVGMDEATRRRAVEPFFTTKGVGQGTGLGLSMAHGLAAQLGGVLRIHSEQGRGTTIEIWLPQSAAAEELAPTEGHGAVLKKREAVALLVDDEDLARASTADMLQDLGFEVHEAVSAEDALSRLNSGLQPRFLVTDHLMPGMSGTELARTVRVTHPDLRILIISGYAQGTGLDLNFPRLIKPFSRMELAAKLSEVDGQSASAKEDQDGPVEASIPPDALPLASAG